MPTHLRPLMCSPTHPPNIRCPSPYTPVHGRWFPLSHSGFGLFVVRLRRCCAGVLKCIRPAKYRGVDSTELLTVGGVGLYWGVVPGARRREEGGGRSHWMCGWVVVCMVWVSAGAAVVAHVPQTRSLFSRSRGVSERPHGGTHHAIAQSGLPSPVEPSLLAEAGLRFLCKTAARAKQQTAHGPP